MITLQPDAPAEELSRLTGLALRGRIALVNSPDSPSRHNTKRGNLFAPRVGIAYRISDRTVIRSGYGIFYLGNDVAFTFAPNGDWANAYTIPFNGTTDASTTPNDVLSNPFPTGLFPPPGRDPNIRQLSWGQGINAAVYDEAYAYAQQWNFDVQRELPGGMALSVAYAGSKGTHLPGPNQQLNQIPPEFFALGNSRLQEQVPNPFFGHVRVGTLSLPRVAYGQLLRPYPHFTSFEMKSPPNRNSIYHSGQLKLEKRFGRGGSILGSYTWSKLITDTDTLTGWLEPGGGAGGAQNNYNIAAERALAKYDTPHRAVISYIVDLPFGKGQPLGGGVTGVLDKLISGWGINGVTTFQSGNPLPVSLAVNQNGFGAGQLPNRTGVSAKLEGPAQERLDQWFNTAAFAIPGAWRFGNSARTMPDARSHGVNNFDVTAFKNTQVTERVGLQFRTEVFNLFNRVRFGYPGTALGNPQFGVISGQLNDPRLIQLALRLLF
jgi:hypothetical protein